MQKSRNRLRPTDRKPAAGGQHHCVRDKVACQDPGGFVRCGGKTPGDVWQRDGGNGRIQHLHECRQHDRQCDQPRIAVGTPVLRIGI